MARVHRHNCGRLVACLCASPRRPGHVGRGNGPRFPHSAVERTRPEARDCSRSVASSREPLLRRGHDHTVERAERCTDHRIRRTVVCDRAGTASWRRARLLPSARSTSTAPTYRSIRTTSRVSTRAPRGCCPPATTATSPVHRRRTRRHLPAAGLELGRRITRPVPGGQLDHGHARRGLGHDHARRQR